MAMKEFINKEKENFNIIGYTLSNYIGAWENVKTEESHNYYRNIIAGILLGMLGTGYITEQFYDELDKDFREIENRIWRRFYL